MGYDLDRKGIELLLMKPGKIFVHHDGALGDTLLSLPCINALRESFPHIHIAGRSDVVCFLREAGLADEVSSADSGFYASLYTDAADEKVREFLFGFERAFVFTAKAGSRLVTNIQDIIPATRTILTMPPEFEGEHISEFRIKQCGNGAGYSQGKMRIRIPDEEKRWAAEFLREQGGAANEQKLIIVHPGSGGKKKCWPLASYVSLINMLMKNPLFFCLVLSGPAEDEETLQILEHLVWKNRRIIHLHDAPLIRVAALMEQAGFYTGNDSGISHLAGIMQCRGIVLFGPTDPRIWRPIGGTLEVLDFRHESGSVITERIHERIEGVFGPHNGGL